MITLRERLRALARSWLGAPALFLGAAAILFWPMLFGGRLFSGQFVPLFHIFFFSAEKFLLVHLHQWPNWWPQFFSGYPIRLTLDGFLNPIFILGLTWFPVIPFYNWLTFVLFVANLCAMYAFVRALHLSRSAALLAAFAYGFSGILIRWTDVIVFTTLFPLLPLSFLAVLKIHEGRRRWWWTWAALLTYAWIGGFAEMLVYFLSGLALFAVYLLVSDALDRRRAEQTPWLRLVAQTLVDGIKKYLTPILLSLLLVSPWLISVVYYIVKFSIRAKGIDLPTGNMPLNLSYFIHLFEPRLSVFYGSNIPLLQLGDDIDLYIGTVSLILLGILPFIWRKTRRPFRLFFLGLLTFTLLMSFESPFYQLIHALPVLNWFRWHFKWTFLTVFAATVLSAYAFDDLKLFIEKRVAKTFSKVLWAVWGLWLIGAATLTIFHARIQARLTTLALQKYQSLAASSGHALIRPPAYYQWLLVHFAQSLTEAPSLKNPWTTLALVLWGLALFIFSLGVWKKCSDRVWRTGLIVVAIAGSVLPWMGFLTGAPESYLTQEPPVVRFLHDREPYRTVPLTDDNLTPYRILDFFPNQIIAYFQETYHTDLADNATAHLVQLGLLGDNIHTWFNIDGSFDHEPLGDARFAEFYHSIVDAPTADPKNGLQKSVDQISNDAAAQRLGAMNVKYVLSAIPLNAPWKRVFESSVDGLTAWVYENPFFQPRWHFAENISWVTESASSSDAMLANGTFDHTTFLEAHDLFDRALPNGHANRNDQLHLKEYTAGRLALESRTADDRWIVFAEDASPFWHVRVDGQDTRLIHANLAFMAVLVPPGTHQVEFYYPGFWEQTRAAIVGLLTPPPASPNAF